MDAGHLGPRRQVEVVEVVFEAFVGFFLVVAVEASADVIAVGEFDGVQSEQIVGGAAGGLGGDLRVGGDAGEGLDRVGATAGESEPGPETGDAGDGRHGVAGVGGVEPGLQLGVGPAASAGEGDEIVFAEQESVEQVGVIGSDHRSVIPE